MSGQKHIVQQGECLSSIAAHYGLPHWNTIYDLPDNKEFRERRPNPNVIAPGDELIIPEKREKSVTVNTGKAYTFVATLPKTQLRLKVFDDIGSTPSNANYELRVAGVLEPIKGTLAGGILEARIPAHAHKAHLAIRTPDTGALIEELDLILGGLDPVETMSGAQMRLRRLGFDCGPAIDEMNPVTEGALRLFQRLRKLTEDGTNSSETQAKLKELAGA